jgi:tyrosyl-DNA phosphodiesterase 2
MNAIAKGDRSLARKFGLKDAWRRGDSDPEGFTWGYQSLEEDQIYPKARLDKILYTPKRRYKVDEPQRIGVGLKVFVKENEEHWVSDHYGLLTALHMVA